jgi:hypothetical protein
LQVGQRAIALEEIEPAGGPRFDRQIAAAQFESAHAPARSLSPDGFMPRKRRTGESSPPVAAGAANFRNVSAPSLRQPAEAPRVASSAQPGRTSSVPVSASGDTALNDPQLHQQLEQIEVDLSLMLAQDRSLWNVAPLRERVQALVEQGSNPAARGQARLLLEKIQQFEAAFDVESAPRTTSSATSAPQSPSAGESEGESKSPLADPRYDAQGLLKPVISRKTNKPAAPYAVVDPDGQPLCFVTPSPGLNLNRYVNKQVGLYGRRGMLEELKKPHVLAERVIDLERQWR